jgi:O-antigen/teichoic acid export membrane protein
MIKKFLHDSFYYTIPSILSKGLAVFLIPLYTKVLNPADYGMLDLFLAYLAFINMTITIDVVSGLARFYINEKDKNNKMIYASTSLFFTIICFTFFVILNIIFFKEISHFVIGSNGKKYFFEIGLAYLWVNGINYVFTNQLRFDLRSKDNAKANILNTIVTVLSTLLFVVVLDFKLNGIILGYLIGSIFTLLYVIYLNRKLYKFVFSSVYLKQMLAFSFPLLFSGISVWINLFADRMMLNHFVTLEQVGIFGIGSRISSIAGIFIIGVQASLGPLIYQKFEEAETPNKIAKIFHFFILLALIGYIFVCLFSKEILENFTTNEYLTANTVIYLLIPATILSQCYSVFAPGPWIFKNSKFVMWTNIIGSVFNILLNLILVPKFGINGAAISTLTTHLIIFIINMVYSQKLYKIPYKWTPILLTLFFTISLILSINYLFLDHKLYYSILSIFLLLFFSKTIKLYEMNDLKSMIYFLKKNK